MGLQRMRSPRSAPHSSAKGRDLGMLNIFPGHPDWAIQTERVIAEAAFGGADVFECERTACKIKIGNLESWHAEWHALGGATEAAGREALAEGAKVTAKQRLFRASNY